MKQLIDASLVVNYLVMDNEIKAKFGFTFEDKNGQLELVYGSITNVIINNCPTEFHDLDVTSQAYLNSKFRSMLPMDEVIKHFL